MVSPKARSRIENIATLIIIDYDSIDREILWTFLGHNKIAEKLIKLIKKTYDHSICMVVQIGLLSELVDMVTEV